MNNTRTIKIYQKVSYLLMLGIIHSALTPVFYKTLSINSLWFFGTGLSLVFLSLLNIAASKLLNPWLLKTTLVATIIATVFSGIITYVLKEPQAFIGLIFHLIVLSACFLSIKVINSGKTIA